ncbi:MAG: hypothetical protein K1W41_03360 [Lachnospiraceae bacterium]
MCELLDRIENRGIAIGEKRGREQINQLVAILLEQNRLDDIKRAISDMNYQEQLMLEYGICEENETELEF